MQENANAQQEQPLIVTPVRVAAMTGIAQPGTRMAAGLVDSLVLSALVAPVQLMEGKELLTSGWLLAAIAVQWVVQAVQLQWWGQTVGMRALKIKLVPVEPGRRLTAGQAWLRCAVYEVPQTWVPLGVWIALLDCAWMFWDKPNRQALHDKVARTVVVTTRQ